VTSSLVVAAAACAGSQPLRVHVHLPKHLRLRQQVMRWAMFVPVTSLFATLLAARNGPRPRSPPRQKGMPLTGIEPATFRLLIECSTIELQRQLLGKELRSERRELMG
jgi:hypothetical protein